MKLISQITIFFSSLILIFFVIGVSYVSHTCQTCFKTENTFVVFNSNHFEDCKHTSEKVTKNDKQLCCASNTQNCSISNECCKINAKYLKIQNILTQSIEKNLILSISIAKVQFFSDIMLSSSNATTLFVNFSLPPPVKIFKVLCIFRN